MVPRRLLRLPQLLGERRHIPRGSLCIRRCRIDIPEALPFAVRDILVNIRDRRIEGHFIALQSHKSCPDPEMRF